MNPQEVADELRRRGAEVWKGDTTIGTDERLHEAARLAKLGGRQPGEPLRPKHINAGQLAELTKDQP
jgi:hypothetical protein